MAGRPNAVGRRSPLGTHYEDLGDPANGEKVPRCAVCGVPETKSIVGRWEGNGLTYRVRICGRCLGLDRRPNPDALRVDDEAA